MFLSRSVCLFGLFSLITFQKSYCSFFNGRIPRNEPTYFRALLHALPQRYDIMQHPTSLYSVVSLMQYVELKWQWVHSSSDVHRCCFFMLVVGLQTGWMIEGLHTLDRIGFIEAYRKMKVLLDA